MNAKFTHKIIVWQQKKIHQFDYIFIHFLIFEPTSLSLILLKFFRKISTWFRNWVTLKRSEEIDFMYFKVLIIIARSLNLSLSLTDFLPLTLWLNSSVVCRNASNWGHWSIGKRFIILPFWFFFFVVYSTVVLFQSPTEPQKMPVG